jgi:uncharacterized repeat protein (TIGR01451 family)
MNPGKPVKKMSPAIGGAAVYGLFDYLGHMATPTTLRLAAAAALLVLGVCAPAAAAATSDMAVTITGPAQAQAGADSTYQLTQVNNGPDPAPSASISATLPPSTSLTSFTQTGGSADHSTQNPGTTRTFTLVMHVDPGVARGTQLTTTAQATTTATDPNSANSSAAITSFVVVPVDLGVTSVAQPSVAAGGIATYLVVAQNSGPNDARNVTLTNTLPPGSTFVSLSQTSGPTFGCGSPTGGAVGCSIDTLGAGAGAAFNLVVRTSPAAASGSSATEQASITSDPTLNIDTGATNDSATAGSVVTAAPDLARPTIKLAGLPKSVKRARLIKKGLRFSETTSEPTAFTATLLGSARSAALRRVSATAFNLTLAQRRLKLGSGKRTIRLKPTRRLLGKARRFNLQVLVTATDAAGNRRTAKRVVKVR